EEFLVLRIRPRPAALNVVNAQFVELVRNEYLIFGGKADGFALRAVAQRGVECENSHKKRTADREQRTESLLACRNTDLLFLFQERHHATQLLTDLLDRLRLRRLAHREEILAAGFVLADPRFGEFAGLDLAQNLLHLFTRLGRDDARTARVIAVLRRV